MNEILKLDRRDFLKLGAMAGGGLALGIYLPTDRPWEELEAAGAALEPNAFLRIEPDGTVTIWCGKADMGQGVRTALPMIVADELDADWSTVRTVQADAHPDKYGGQMTVGSRSVRGGAWTALRKAGASAREMLVAAAAAGWGVSAAECRTRNGRVIHDASGRSAGYGELAEAAAAQPVPAEPRLKDPSEFTLIGTRVPQVDTHLKVTGQAIFGLDARVPGMLFATAVHSPVFYGSLRSVDAMAARRVAGVRDVVEISRGVAVVAENTWAAFQGAKALQIEWEPGDFSMSSDEISRHHAEITEGEGAVARDDGDASAALAQSARRIEATYEVPYLAHATMEPMNCTADVRRDRCEIWAPTQNPQGAQSTAARLTGLSPERVTVHVTYLGCGWGRRSSADFVQDAIEISSKVGAPVQMVWTREEDMQHDFYRPTSYQRLEGGVDGEDRLSALRIRVAAPPINYARRGAGRPGVDRNSVNGIVNAPYTIPNFFVDYCRSEVPVPTGHWRSVGPSGNTFIFESFIDELAHLAGRDPFEFRREMLAEEPRMRRVLELAAEKSGWGSPPPADRARGIALVVDKGGRVAHVAEVSLQNGRPRVHRVTTAADFGQVIHPGIVEAQVVGSTVAGLTTLFGEITLDGGRVVQSNFTDYPMLRINEMPEVSVHLVESHEEPGGVGEPAVPSIAPAVTNAFYALTGTRIRRLPIRTEEVSADANG